jgi:hypothetical protein
MTTPPPPLSPALEELQAAARPLMDYLKKRHHPHLKAIVDSDSAEIVEGIACVRALATELRQEGRE